MELLMCECLVARRQFFCSRKYDFIEGEGKLLLVALKKVNKKPNLVGRNLLYSGLDVAAFLEKAKRQKANFERVQFETRKTTRLLVVSIARR